ncbi:GTP-binding protein [Lusitaniella coriacea LEGE 07157]|uniref:GTP-binding protein n=1 Tax=Lusitaniella coriacea LEGE 07157 TaxID=945747 RepID=A0A8J7IWI4_9CYAN|nr:GTP-binding protein [Lusitaniella coriacea]MBE9118063.1 GTP-binding protein [Lusitaniella coriacea LEGE 07157]
MTSSPQETHFNQARASLQQALSWYSSFRRHGRRSPEPELQAAVRNELQAIKGALDKLDRKVICIATFGLVSRGKSAVVNALLGQKILQTGPINGVTKYPKSVRWMPPGGKIEVELIDTPGLDEIDGQARAEMAREVARQADLILFVVSGDITRTEYQALCELRQSQKPLLLVFNKIDLYPDRDRAAIYQQLYSLGNESGESDSLQSLLSLEEIIAIAAEPAPQQVRIEWPDDRVTYEWETPEPQVDALREKILGLLNREGRSLLALNALFQAKEAEESLARKTLELCQEEAEETIWKYARYKALAVALNPIAIFDVAGGMMADLALIRALARLYGLPMTSFAAGQLWRKILVSSGGVLLGEIGSSLLVGLGKSTAAAVSVMESPAALTAYLTAASAQGAIAGYGAYTVGKAAQAYLEQGCTWGSLGPSTVIQNILSQINSSTILYRLREELEEKIR